MKSLRVLFLLSLAGFLFSGYLSFVKLVSGSCALNEPCPYFLGYPACFYGFAMYLALLTLTTLALFTKSITPYHAIKSDTIISGIGVAFSGGFVIQEIARSMIAGTLGLSTCVYGFVFYVAIFFVALAAFKAFNHIRPQT